MRFVLYLLSLLVPLGLANNMNSTSSRVEVHIPFDLHGETGGDGFEHVQAQFGFQQKTSGSIAASVYFVDGPLCSPLQYNHTAYPKNKDQWQAPFILMVNSDKCSAVSKARNAQLAGASALILAHEHCRCSDAECTKEFGPDCQEASPVLVNDGSGADVSIPSFLLYRIDAHNVTKVLKTKRQPVLMELTWGLKDDETSSSEPPIYYHLWTTAHDPLMDLETYDNMRTVAKAFKGHAHFSPRFSILDGTLFECTSQVDTGGPCDHLCTNHGRYCALHAKKLSGNAIIKETLRRLCIWKEYGEPHDGNPDVYWDYVVYHRENCNKPDEFASDDCVKKSLDHAKAKAETVDKCMTDSGGLEQDAQNTMLEDMLTKQKQSGVVTLPAVTVNRTVLDHTSSYRLFEAICMKFWLSNSPSVPDVCEKCSTCPNSIGCIKEGHCVAFSKKSDDKHHDDSDAKKKKGHGKLFFSFFLILCIAGGVWYYKQRNNEFGNRAGLLNGYLQLSGEG